ncbi:MAG: hypothetical protein ABH816_01770 [Candidatus Levyibacteriota bacterium]
MKKNLKDFHHYKGNELNRFEKVEKRVIELILDSKIPNEEREESKVFELMHSSGCMAIGRVLAQKRGLNVDIASVISIIHDISTIISGTYKDHGKLGAEISEKILQEVGGFTEIETKIITQAVCHHSEKEVYTDKPYVEFIKDLDAFECSLYKNSEGFYKIHKAPHVLKEYIKRIKKVRKEFGLKATEVFR